MNTSLSLKNSRKAISIASAVAVGAALAVGMSVWATSVGTNVSVTGTLTVTDTSTLTGAVTASGAVSVGTDLTVTSGARVGADQATLQHITALADDSLFVEGQAEFDGIVWFDGSLRASSTLLVTSAATFYSDVTLVNATSTNFAITTFATTSALRVSNDATIQGNTTLGTEAADTLTINATSSFANNAGVLGSFFIGDTSADVLTVTATSTLKNGITVEGGAAFIGAGGVSITNTLQVTGATTHSGTTKMGTNGTALTQVQSGTVHCGPLVDSQSIAATSTGVIACWDGLSNVIAGDKVFLTATSTTISAVAGAVGASVVYTGKASTTAANFIQAELMNLTNSAWTVATSSWYYLIIR